VSAGVSTPVGNVGSTTKTVVINVAVSATLTGNPASKASQVTDPMSLMAVSTVDVGTGQGTCPNVQTTLAGGNEQSKTASIPAAQPKPASTAADSLSNVLLPTATLQAAHDAVFSGGVVDGSLGSGKAATNAGLATVAVNLGSSSISKTSLPQPCGSSTSTKK